MQTNRRSDPSPLDPSRRAASPRRGGARARDRRRTIVAVLPVERGGSALRARSARHERPNARSAAGPRQRARACGDEPVPRVRGRPAARALARASASGRRGALGRSRARRRRHPARDRRDAARAASPASPTCTTTPDVVGDVAVASGMRAVLGMIVLDFPTAWARDAERVYPQGARGARSLQGRAA